MVTKEMEVTDHNLLYISPTKKDISFDQKLNFISHIEFLFKDFYIGHTELPIISLIQTHFKNKFLFSSFQ